MKPNLVEEVKFASNQKQFPIELELCLMQSLSATNSISWTQYEVLV